MQPVRDWLIVGGIFAAALVIGGWLVLMPFRGHVTGPVGVKATRLMAMPAMTEEAGPGSSAYQWLDAGTILIHDRTEDYAVDVATGAKSVPTWISQSLKKFGGKVSTGFYGWVLSPDRKWAVASVSRMTESSPSKLPLVLGGRMNPGLPPSKSGLPSFPETDGHWLLARLDGSLTVDVGKAQDLIDQPIWRPDSSGWFELDQSTEETGTVAECAISGARVTRKVVDRETKEMSPMTVIGAISGDKLLTMAGGDDDGASGDDDDVDTAMMLPYNVVHFAKGKEVVDTTYKYSFGMMSIPFGHEISPDGSQIVWNEMSTKSSTAGILIQATVMHKSTFDMTVTVSNTDGTGMRVLVSEPIGGQGVGPSNVRWMPDGKHISYVDNGALWSVPVN